VSGRGALALAGLLVTACGDDSVPPAVVETAPAPAQREREQEQDLGYLEELAALGYVDHAPHADGSASGVVVHDVERASPGYTLITSIPSAAAILIDMQGEVVRAWRDREGYDTRWTRARLLSNGDLVALSPKENWLIRFDWDGNLLWRQPYDVHHDFEPQPDGTLLVLTRKRREIPAIDPVRKSVDDSLTSISATGDLLASHSLYDILAGAPEILQVRPPEHASRLPETADIDPVHCNTARWIRRPDLAEKSPLFGPDNVLVTLRYSNAIAIVDVARDELLWAWGEDELEGPHDAAFTAAGTILLFDNGWGARGYSRVVEMDPTTREIVWQYKAPEPTDFYSASRGTVQELPNRNILVGNSNNGEVFEVTRAGEVVWRYFTPFADDQGARAVLRAERYAELPRPR